MKIPEALSYSKIMSQYETVRSERSEWETQWREISEYLLPGRGIFQTYTKPRKRQLTSTVVNNIGEDALYNLTAEIHGRLTSPARPWFNLEWSDPRIKDHDVLKMWLETCQKRLYNAFSVSNFYSIINSYYPEYAGYGTAPMYVGEDTGTDEVPFKFELLTAGEYDITIGGTGKIDKFFRTIFMTPRQLVERFPDTVSKELKKSVEENTVKVEKQTVTIVEHVCPMFFRDKPFTQIRYEVTSQGGYQSHWDEDKKPLSLEGFYEFPYPTARWSVIGSDVYGTGPGARAIPHIKRLQEMESTNLMAFHKDLDPPVNAPARMKGKLKTLPGGRNYYSNPQEVITDIYSNRFNFESAAFNIERVEQRIQKIFHNDLFLIGTRDPNATPYKATEVEAREREKLLRLGPVVEKLYFELLQPVVERCFNIMLRKELFPPLSPELAAIAGEYKVVLVSPLATAQRAAAFQGVNSFLAFVGSVAQFDQEVLDNVDTDKAAREMADIEGVNLGILRPIEAVEQRRAERRKQQAAQIKREQENQDRALAATLNQQQAETMKTQAEAGQALIESQGEAVEAGVL